MKPVSAILSVCALLSASPALANQDALGVPLAPGERILGTILAAGPIVRIPEARVQPTASARTRIVPVPLEIDPVTRRPRNARGWSGSTRQAASIACFPAGACRHLNAR